MLQTNWKVVAGRALVTCFGLSVFIKAVVIQAVGAQDSDYMFMLAQHNKTPLKYLHICAYVQIFLNDKIRIARPCPTAESARGIQPAVTGL